MGTMAKLESGSEFHTLWGQAKESPEYDKQAWMSFQHKLLGADKRIAELEACEEAAIEHRDCGVELRMATKRIAELEGALREAMETLREVRDHGCRIARAEDVTDKHGFVAVPHEDAVTLVRETIAKLGTGGGE